MKYTRQQLCIKCISILLTLVLVRIAQAEPFQFAVFGDNRSGAHQYSETPELQSPRVRLPACPAVPRRRAWSAPRPGRPTWAPRPRSDWSTRPSKKHPPAGGSRCRSTRSRRWSCRASSRRAKWLVAKRNEAPGERPGASCCLRIRLTGYSSQSSVRKIDAGNASLLMRLAPSGFAAQA